MAQFIIGNDSGAKTLRRITVQTELTKEMGIPMKKVNPSMGQAEAAGRNRMDKSPLRGCKSFFNESGCQSCGTCPPIHNF